MEVEVVFAFLRVEDEHVVVDDVDDGPGVHVRILKNNLYLIFNIYLFQNVFFKPTVSSWGIRVLKHLLNLKWIIVLILD
jgi:hypothetical protein